MTTHQPLSADARVDTDDIEYPPDSDALMDMLDAVKYEDGPASAVLQVRRFRGLLDEIISLRSTITTLSTSLETAVAGQAALIGALRGYAYEQGTDSDGWFRMCRLCGEETRISTDIEPIGEFPHSVACVLNATTAAASYVERLEKAEAEVAFAHKTNAALQACLEGEVKLKARITELTATQRTPGTVEVCENCDDLVCRRGDCPIRKAEVKP